MADGGTIGLVDLFPKIRYDARLIFGKAWFPESDEGGPIYIANSMLLLSRLFTQHNLPH